MKSIVGALRVMLGMDSAEFEDGVDSAARTAKRLEGDLKKTSKRLTKFGAGLSAAFTAPILGAAAAFSAAAHQMAQDSREITHLSQVAGETTVAFQRQAFAAKQVGIENEKLSDIFKDMRDRVGDFIATGGGPMADFFENIAPKVGITAEAFKGLSGKDSLQLYFDSLRKANVSQEEMVFYLEAMASDATALIPLLENGGQAFDEFGKKANVITPEMQAQFERYVQAQEQLGVATQKLTIAMVESGLLDTAVGLVEAFADFATYLSKVNPMLLQVGVGAAAVLAALGPLVLVAGQLVPLLKFLPGILTGIGVAFRFMLGPVGLAITAVGALWLAWKNWDKIEPILRNLYEGVKTWLTGKMGEALAWVMRKVNAVRETFADLYDAVVGNSYVPDMVDGIAAEFARLDAVMVDPARRGAASVKDAMRDMARETKALLDRLFPEIAAARQMASERALIDGSGLSDADKRRARFRLVSEGAEAPGIRGRTIGEGPLAEADKVNRATVKINTGLEQLAERSRVVTVRIAENFAALASRAISSLRGLVDAIRGGDFLSILEGVFGIVGQLGGLSGQGGLLGKIGDFFGGARAMGGPVSAGKAYLVGERGPELFTPGQSGRITANDNLRGGGPSITVNVDARGASDPEATKRLVRDGIFEAAPRIVAAAEQKTISTLGRKRLGGAIR